MFHSSQKKEVVEKRVPSDVESEMYLIHSLISNPLLLDKITLGAHQFHNNSAKYIFNTIEELKTPEKVFNLLDALHESPENKAREARKTDRNLRMMKTFVFFLR